MPPLSRCVPSRAPQPHSVTLCLSPTGSPFQAPNHPNPSVCAVRPCCVLLKWQDLHGPSLVLFHLSLLMFVIFGILYETPLQCFVFPLHKDDEGEDFVRVVIMKRPHSALLEIGQGRAATRQPACGAQGLSERPGAAPLNPPRRSPQARGSLRRLPAQDSSSWVHGASPLLLAGSRQLQEPLPATPDCCQCPSVSHVPPGLSSAPSPPAFHRGHTLPPGPGHSLHSHMSLAGVFFIPLLGWPHL